MLNLLKFVSIAVISCSLCYATNVLNILDFAAPIYEIINSYTPEVCYDELGCFRNDGIFATSQTRPISVVPQPPQLIGTEYHLYTRGNPNNPQIIDAFNTNYFSQIEFNPKLNTKVFIHGYKKSMIFGEWQQTFADEIRDAMLYNEGSNVIVVKWIPGASGLYFQAVANTRVVGSQIALFINYLINERNANSEQFHLIGFSLGAHIAGYVGEQVPNLGRITALDAAKPYFGGLSTEVRLNPSDALLVDAIHTDNGIGTDSPIGHIDIYINSGNNQPGCEQQVIDAFDRGGIFNSLSETILCDHKRSIEVYSDFLFKDDRDCIPIAYRCENWERFQLGYCSKCGHFGEDCAIVGISSALNQFRKSNSKFYIITNYKKPFCVFQYLIQMTTFTNNHQLNGKFFMRFYSSNNTTAEYESRSLKIWSEEKTSFLISSFQQIYHFERLDLIFTHNSIIDFDNSIAQVKSLRITPLNILDDNVKKMYSKMYCTPGNDWIVIRSELYITLSTRYCK